MKKIKEEWKRIEGFPNHEISNMGRCRNTKNGMMLQVQKNVVLKKNGGKYYT
jgi:hypothetical protein